MPLLEDCTASEPAGRLVPCVVLTGVRHQRAAPCAHALLRLNCWVSEGSSSSWQVCSRDSVSNDMTVAPKVGRTSRAWLECILARLAAPNRTPYALQAIRYFDCPKPLRNLWTIGSRSDEPWAWDLCLQRRRTPRPAPPPRVCSLVSIW